MSFARNVLIIKELMHVFRPLFFGCSKKNKKKKAILSFRRYRLEDVHFRRRHLFCPTDFPLRDYASLFVFSRVLGHLRWLC